MDLNKPNHTNCLAYFHKSVLVSMAMDTLHYIPRALFVFTKLLSYNRHVLYHERGSKWIANEK